VAVISSGLWRSEFGGGDVLGRTLTLDGRRHTVVGVMPPEFHLSAPFDDTPVWLPLSMADPAEHQSPFAIGRLREGVTAERANQELAAIAAGLDGLQGAASWPGIARRPQDLNGSTLRTSLVMMQGTVAIVLLIACANVANLLLARGAGRHADMAVRAALGAGRGRLFQQLLTEHLMLAMGGGLLGYGLARAGVAVLVALRPEEITALAAVRVDGGIFFFALAVAALTGTLFGLVPALQASRPAVVESLKAAGRSPAASHGRSWLRDALIVGEVALAVPLLVAAGLLLGSLGRLVNADLGFDTSHVLTMHVSLPESRYPTEVERHEFRDTLETRIRQVAGGRLDGLAVSGSALPTLGLWFGTFGAEGQESIDAFTNVAAHAGAVSPGYFNTLGVGLVDGRYFGPDDLARSDNPVILNATWARRMWGDEKAAGKRLWVETPSGPSYHHVVGVIEDAMLVGPTGSMGDLQIFQPADDFSTLAMLVRTTDDPSPLAGSFRELVWAIDPDLPVRDVRRLDQVYAGRLALQRFQVTVLGGFAVVAVVLALIGVYGVLSQIVGQRREEIGIRLALGASRARVVSMVCLHGMRTVLAGVGIGVVVAAALTRFIESHLYEVRALDPTTYMAASALVVIAAAFACLMPTLAASRLDATTVLRRS
jgi:predicted permease